MEFCIKLYVTTPWLFVQFWNFSALQHYLCHQPLFYSQESWALFQFPTNVSISLHMGLALQVIFAKVFVRKSYWNSIAQLGRNSRLKNTPRIIQKYAEKKLSDINKKNLPFIRSQTKKSDLNSGIIMQLSLIMWRWIRSWPFFSGPAFILENVMAAATGVDVFSVPISKSILVQISG